MEKNVDDVHVKANINQKTRGEIRRLTRTRSSTQMGFIEKLDDAAASNLGADDGVTLSY